VYPHVTQLASSYVFKTVTDDHLFEKIHASKLIAPLLPQEKSTLKAAVNKTFDMLYQSPAMHRFQTRLSEAYTNPSDFSDEPYEPQSHPGFPYCVNHPNRESAYPDAIADAKAQYPSTNIDHIHILLNKPEFKPKPGKHEYVLARPIMCANLKIHLLCSKVFRVFQEFIIESHPSIPIKLGMSWMKNGAQHLFSSFPPGPGIYESSDFRTWDFTVPSFIHFATLNLFHKFVDIINPPNADYFKKLATSLVTDFVNSKFFTRDCPNVFQKFQGTSTGYYLTALFNSLSHLVIHNYVLLSYQIAHPIPFQILFRDNYKIIYGDDNIKKAMENAVPPSFYAQILKRFGMTTYDIQEPSSKLSDHQFLRTWSTPSGTVVYPQRDHFELLLKLIYTNEDYSQLQRPAVLSNYKGFLVSFIILDPTNNFLYTLVKDMFLSLSPGPIHYSPKLLNRFSQKKLNLVLYQYFPSRF